MKKTRKLKIFEDAEKRARDIIRKHGKEKALKDKKELKLNEELKF